MGRILAATSILGLVVASAGCTGPVQRDSAAPIVPLTDFDGSWSTEWCDRTRPDLDCGGFSVTLVQEGDRICGGFGGALVNLRQVDEGDITGRIEDGVAILEVRSGRNDSVERIRATRVGETLHWKQVGTIHHGGSDIAVIALDDVLQPTTTSRHGTPKACETPPS